MAGGTLRCEIAADADGNGVVNVTDAILVLEYLFSSGLPPAAPFPEAGALADYETELGCDTSLPYFYAKQ